MRRPARILTAVLAVTATLTASRESAAAERYVRPFVSAAAEYNDNLRLEVDPVESVTGLVVNAAADIGRRDAVSDVSFRPRARIARWDSQFDLDTDDAYLDFNAERRFQRATLGIEASVAEDSALTSELLTTGRVQTTTPRSAWSVAPSWTQAITRLDSLEVGASYTEVEYEDDARLGLNDYRSSSASAGYLRALSPRNTISVTAFASRFVAPGIPTVIDVPLIPGLPFVVGVPVSLRNETTSYGIQAGITSVLTPTLSGSLSAGVRRTEFDISSELGQSSADDTGNVFSGSLRYEGRKSTLDASISQSLVPTASGRVLDQYLAEVAYDYELDRRQGFSVDLTAGRNEELLGGVQTQNRDFAVTSLRYRHNLTRQWYLVGSYRYRLSSFEDSADTAESNAVLVTITWNGVRRDFLD